jgi:hypothetical protein
MDGRDDRGPTLKKMNENMGRLWRRRRADQM